jgi:hypothetical protein
MSAKMLGQFPVHLGLGGAMASEPEFGRDMSWYADYEQRHAADGADGRLISEFVFTEDWQSWERHPVGAELVYCISGSLTLHQELADGSVATTSLLAGQYAINPPGVWHTADVAVEARALFITAGAGTENRPR